MGLIAERRHLPRKVCVLDALGVGGHVLLGGRYSVLEAFMAGGGMVLVLVAKVGVQDELPGRVDGWVETHGRVAVNPVQIHASSIRPGKKIKKNNHREAATRT